MQFATCLALMGQLSSNAKLGEALFNAYPQMINQGGIIMDLTSLLQQMAMNRSKTVTIDCSAPKEYPGYVRTITIAQDNIARVEFEVHGYDEGGITYFIEYENVETLVKMMEQYLGKGIADWENINQTGSYPDKVDVDDLEAVHQRIENDMVNDQIKIPLGGMKTWKPGGYWKKLYDKNREERERLLQSE